jgi:hypothetical protein
MVPAIFDEYAAALREPEALRPAATARSSQAATARSAHRKTPPQQLHVTATWRAHRKQPLHGSAVPRHGPVSQVAASWPTCMAHAYSAIISCGSLAPGAPYTTALQEPHRPGAALPP